MVGTRHAVSDNKSRSGLGIPFPQRRNGDCDHHEVQNDIQSFSEDPLCPPETGGRAKRRGYDETENCK